MNTKQHLRAILIDDEFMGLNSLRIQLMRHCPTVNSVAESMNPESAIELIENYCPDLVFLDINMPEMNGFELLEKLKWKKFDLVFTTAHQEFALKALKAEAIDYLLKPIDPVELKKAVQKVLNRKLTKEQNLENKFDLLQSYQCRIFHKQKLIVNIKEGIESVETSMIIVLESQAKHTKITLESGQILTSVMSLKNFDQLICNEGNSFMRVHNSFIINLNKILRYIKFSETVIMQNGTEIPISKARKSNFVNWLDT